MSSPTATFFPTTCVYLSGGDCIEDIHTHLSDTLKNVRGMKVCSPYSSPDQLSLIGFETPFYNQLDPNNRWVILSAQVP